MASSACVAPQALRRGDDVAVVAPAGPVPSDRLRRGLAILAQRYRVRCDPGLWRRDGYLAGSDEERAASVNRALADSSIRAIFCARGGYGVTRILPSLDAAALRDDPKPVVGFSDITALLAWANAAGVVAVHGPVVTQLGGLPGGDVAHLFHTLEQPGLRGRLAGRRLTGARGAVRGPLLGGNTLVLGGLAGTPWQPCLAGALLLLEDVAEASYRLDRVATQLLQQAAPFGAGDIAGLGVGDLARCRDEPGRPPALAVLVERLANGAPVVTGLPFGHGARNRAWPMGLAAELDSERGEIHWRGAVQ